MKKTKQIKDWRGEKGKYYDYGFEDGRRQALEEVEKIINEFPFRDYNRFELGIEAIKKGLKLQIKKEMKHD